MGMVTKALLLFSESPTREVPAELCLCCLRSPLLVASAVSRGQILPSSSSREIPDGIQALLSTKWLEGTSDIALHLWEPDWRTFFL